MLNLVWVDELDGSALDEVRALLLAAREVDGRPEVDAGGPLPDEFSGGLHLLAHAESDLVGYAHLDTTGDSFGRQVAELIVRPDRRHRGFATQLVEALVDKAGAVVSQDKLRVWSHGDHPAAARIAERAGFTRARELLVMHAPVAESDWPEPSLPQGVTLRTFVPGQDEQAVVDVNARAFDWHPEQGALTVEELRATEEEDWFDAAGFFLAERDGKVIGFHWTKVHPADPDRFDGEPVGEVYVVGVDPGAQGGGLGRALTLAGLRHLRERGLGHVILYVEGDNAPAIAVYSRLGFTRYAVDVQYAR
ncbi:mycothiol synthase [Amycolatopsis acidiphila]|uniref:Mycothiol acetyltransferase n=1 Tax=Amycolatopsis acidiphila TaxID=715473 RepID=A0A558A2H4_9PSEU|nr:mycothiol synthase [Amycolatopsis acidiphila]TVT18460.1 mycothiol synthase [Amycolatopsis acidiphila]UIJ60027.1 mycothiol synthase [Amycolatopsis acidiphila]GHG61783.1 mycothiol acetyltransferase [Amycolatopsis acidiphila]